MGSIVAAAMIGFAPGSSPGATAQVDRKFNVVDGARDVVIHVDGEVGRLLRVGMALRTGGSTNRHKCGSSG